MTFDLVKIFRTNSSDTTKTSRRKSRATQVDNSHAEHHKHAPLPFFASPVDPEALKWLAKRKRSSSGVARSTTVAQFEAESESTESELAHRIFRKQHEASTLELFFDLFFVANLAVFTTKSAHVDVQSLANYMGFFAILWTTWFHISMYDVRFYVDSVFTRICKFLCFGIFVSFVGLTSMYDAILTGGLSRSFQGIALLLFASRILWVIQYAAVLWFVRGFGKTNLPILLTMAVYIAAGLGFLGSWIQDRGSSALDGVNGASHVRIWYIIICIEAVAIILIASIWRILSFKHTHLVERVGLLSLIVMGEGIIGLVKSTSYAIQGTQVTVWQETGIVASSVLMIYMIYVLYFDNIDHHRFGTIAQQIWTLLHYPLHVAILLTVEGSTALIIWSACRSAISYIVEDMLPSLTNPKGKFNDAASWLAQVNSTYYKSRDRFYYKNLTDYYPTFPDDLAKLGKTKAAFGTDGWKSEVVPTLQKMRNYYEYFVYQNFGAEGPTYKLKKTTDYGKKAQLYEDSFKFVVMYFYIAAGSLLIVLALLYWFGRRQKTKTEWFSVGIRLLAGMCLPIMVVSPLTEKGDDQSFRFQYAGLLIPIVALAFLLVIIVDNTGKAISDKHYTLVEEKRISKADMYDTKSTTAAETTELTDEESSYEMHRQSGQPRSTAGMQHGSPELMPYENASLIANAQKTPIVQFDDQHRGGYAPVGSPNNLPEYHDGDDRAHFQKV